MQGRGGSRSSSSRGLAPIAGVPLTAIVIDEASDDALRDFQAAEMGSIINHLALANALFAFSVSPLLEELQRDGVLAMRSAIAKHKLVESHAVGLARYLVLNGLLVEEPDLVFALTPKGRATFSPGTIGLLQMYRGGYGHLMTGAGALLDGSVTYGRDVSRDGGWTARGSSAMTHAQLDETAYRVLETTGKKRIADLGCGAGDFLLDWVRRSPEHSGVGVDLSPEAMAFATERARAAGLSDRVRFAVGNCFDLDVLRKHCSDVEVFYAFAMEHELLRDGEKAVLDHIDGMAAAFSGRTYLLGEPLLTMTQGDGVFYWIHILSHQGLPRDVPGWCDLLNKLGRAKLAHAYVADHRRTSAYFDIRL